MPSLYTDRLYKNMEVITIETEAFRRIMERLEVMEEYIRQAKLGQKAVLADDDWVDSVAVCRYLRICDKTLQRLRLDGKISYSVIGKKNYYQIAEDEPRFGVLSKYIAHLFGLFLRFCSLNGGNHSPRKIAKTISKIFHNLHLINPKSGLSVV